MIEGEANSSRLERARHAGQRALASAWLRTGGKLMPRLFRYDLTVRTRNWGTTNWLGVPIWQNVLDLWTIQETLAEVRPALLIEIGTHYGGSALFYANLMDLLGHGRLLTIDVIQIHELDHERIRCLHGSSLDPAIVDEVRREVEATDGPVMVIVDGNHARDHVAQELEVYSEFVTPGSFILSQDGSIDEMGIFRDTRPGPLPANREFLERHTEFEYDAERNERFGVTHHPLGWLRRRPA